MRIVVCWRQNGIRIFHPQLAVHAHSRRSFFPSEWSIPNIRGVVTNQATLTTTSAASTRIADRNRHEGEKNLMSETGKDVFHLWWAQLIASSHLSFASNILRQMHNYSWLNQSTDQLSCRKRLRKKSNKNAIIDQNEHALHTNNPQSDKSMVHTCRQCQYRRCDICFLFLSPRFPALAKKNAVW